MADKRTQGLSKQQIVVRVSTTPLQTNLPAVGLALKVAVQS